MVFSPPLVEGEFVVRLNRFAARVRVGGQDVLAHVPNSGRMTELLVPGAPALLAPAPQGAARKTAYDLTLIRYRDQWVGVDARLPSALFAEALAEGRLAPFRDFTDVRREARWGTSRFDFLLSADGRSCLVETKSVNLVEDGTALFPDAPTARGVRHLETLIASLEKGMEAAVVFVVQRADAVRLMPHRGADPAFAAALAAAGAAGVMLLACTCHVTPREMRIDGPIPVEV